MKKGFVYIIAIVMVLATLAILPMMLAEALVGYNYSAVLQINNTGGAFTGRVVYTVDAANLVSSNYIQADGEDVALSELGTEIQAMPTNLSSATANWYTDIVTVGASSSNQLELWLGDPDLTKSHLWIAMTGDTVTVSDAASLDITTNLTLSADTNLYEIPSAESWFIRKPGAYGMGMRNGNTVFGFIGDDATYTTSSSDGHIEGSNNDYNTAWNAASGTTVSASAASFNIGQSNGALPYNLYRSFVFFDTSAIPDGATIIASTLRLYGSSDASATDFNITIQNGMPTYPSDPLVLGDYDRTNYSGDGGTLNTSSFNASGWNEIALNATGIGWINDTGATKFSLRSDREIAGTTPAGDEYVAVQAQEGANAAQLIVVIETEVSAAAALNQDYDLTYDGADLKLYINGSEAATTAATFAIAVNTSDVEIADGFMGPMEDLRIGDTSIIGPTWRMRFLFEPDEISGTTITDQSGEGNDATFTLVGNPGGLTAVLGTLTPTKTTSSTGVTDTTTPDIVTEPSLPSGYIQPTPAQIPLFAFFEEMANNAGVPVTLFLVPAAIILAVLIGTAVAVVTGSPLIGVLVTSLGVAIGISTGLLPYWVIFPFVFITMAMLVMRRVASF